MSGQRIPVVRADGYLWQYEDDPTGQQLALGPSGHVHELGPWLRTLLARGVFLDVGAHVGHWSVRLAGQASKVIAVEPNPETARILRTNVAMNNLSNVVVYEVAAWDCDTMLRLEPPDGLPIGGGTRVLDDGKGTVKAVRLDALLAAEPAVDLVKLDVEGADLHALEGMRGLLAKHRPAMLVECHDMYGYYDFGDMEALISDLGYSYNFVLHRGYFVAQPG
jgi:FkbM family methyltransferase